MPTSVDVTSTFPCISGGVAVAAENFDGLIAASSLNQICSGNLGCDYISGIGNPFYLPEDIATDGHGQEWVANSGNASVTTFNGVDIDYAETSGLFYLHGPADGNTITTPYGIAIDGSGNVWVSNAGCVTTSATLCTPGAFVLSELIGAAGPTITPLVNQNGGVFAGYTPGTQPTSDAKGQPVPASHIRAAWSQRHPGTPFAQPHTSGAGVSIPWLARRVR
jgi:hypothetical protein